MIFKPWAEVPVARHLLDENDDLDELEAKGFGSIKPFAKVSATVSNVKSLVLLCPRLNVYSSGLAAAYGTFPVGMLECGYNVEHARTGDDEGDNNEEEETPLAKTTEPISTEITRLDNNTYMVSLPHIEPLVCYETAKQLITSLNPQSVVVLSPVNAIPTSQPLYQVCCHRTGIKNVPSLPPPFMLTGIGASILSRCDTAKIPCTVLAVKAEGPSGFEIVDHSATSPSVLQALTALLQPPSRITVAEARPDGLYI